MTPETINAIKTALEPVAAKIGQIAEWGWGVILRQQYVVAFRGLVLVLFSLIWGYTVYCLTKLMWKLKAADKYSDWEIGGIVIPIIGGIIFVFMFFGGLDTAITHFVNPQYYAIDFFIHLGQSTN